MRLLIPAALAAILLVPTAAQACDKCIYHGTARENAAWATILAKPEAQKVQIAKAVPAKTAPVKAAPAAKVAAKKSAK